MLKCYINGFVSSSCRKTLIRVYDDASFGTAEAQAIFDGYQDRDGLISFELEDQYSGKPICVVAVDMQQKYLKVTLTPQRDGLYHTVYIEPELRETRKSIGFPADWQEVSQANLDSLRATRLRTPLETLSAWSTDARVRYAQHFSAEWSAFNAWYNEILRSRHYRRDRECIDALRFPSEQDESQPKLAFETLLAETAVHVGVQDALVEGYKQYLSPSLLSDFVGACFQNSDLRSRFFVYAAPYRTEEQPRCLGLTFLPDKDYKKLYVGLREVLASENGIVESEQSVQQVFLQLGIGSHGQCFFVEKHPLAKPHTPVQTEFIRNVLLTTPALKDLVDFQSAYAQRGIWHGVLELLYCVRNACVHGHLAPLQDANEPVFEASYRLLAALLQKMVRC